MTWLTLKELNNLGLQIIKGEKCRLRDPDGVCLWHDSQMKEHIRPIKHERDSDWDYQSDYDMDDYDYDWGAKG